MVRDWGLEMGGKAVVGRAGQSAPITELFGGIPPTAFPPTRTNRPLSQNDPLLQKVLTERGEQVGKLARQLLTGDFDGNLDCRDWGSGTGDRKWDVHRFALQRNLQFDPLTAFGNGKFNGQP